MNNKKRKRNQDILSRLNVLCEDVHLRVKIPQFMPCEICQKPIFDYQTLNHCIVCCYECFEIWKLSQQNTFLDEKPTELNFDSALKRSITNESIDKMVIDDVYQT